ncbi:Facilitated glucose transporter protein [Trichinella spiralis]|uniref:Facilitated glucose transporter protein n=1 Tax=Trichinella spiralis TaxID=6334 RepID=A0ABR3KKH1_TRISP
MDQLTCWLAFSIFAATFGCSFIFGYNIAVINTPQVIIEQWINETLIEKNQTWTQSKMDSVWALIVGIFPFGGFIGGMLSGLVADKVGRRNGMLLNNIFAILAVSVMSVTQYTTSYICLIVGRFVIGINCGISSALCPMYLTEISPIKLRGMLGTFNQLVVSIAILLAQILGLEAVLGSKENWPILFYIIAIPAIFQLCSLPFCSESPKYLIAHGSSMEKVQKDLQKLRQVENVNSEIEAIQYEMNAATATPKVLFLDMFRDRILRWALFISIMMMFSQQFSGINAVLFYSTKIFMDGAGLSETNAQFATLGVGLINVLMTIVSAVLIDKAGRRMLQLIGLGGMWISCIALSVSIIYMKQNRNWISYMCICFVFLFVVFFAVGPSSIPWFYTNEIFLQNARGYANAIAASANWMSSFLVGWIFPLMANALEEYTFLVFVGTLAVFWLFTYKFVPETKIKRLKMSLLH